MAPCPTDGVSGCHWRVQRLLPYHGCCKHHYTCVESILWVVCHLLYLHLPMLMSFLKLIIGLTFPKVR